MSAIASPQQLKLVHWAGVSGVVGRKTTRRTISRSRVEVDASRSESDETLSAGEAGDHGRLGMKRASPPKSQCE
jgi:hypothetical protein